MPFNRYTHLPEHQEYEAFMSAIEDLKQVAAGEATAQAALLEVLKAIGRVIEPEGDPDVVDDLADDLARPDELVAAIFAKPVAPAGE